MHFGVQRDDSERQLDDARPATDLKHILHVAGDQSKSRPIDANLAEARCLGADL